MASTTLIDSLVSSIERDIDEFNRAIESELWLSSLVMAGAILEGLLLSRLRRRRKKAEQFGKQQNWRGSLESWDLGRLRDAADYVGLTNPKIEQLTPDVRHYRNMVHPGNELRGKEIVKPTRNRALRALHLVQALWDQLYP